VEQGSNRSSDRAPLLAVSDLKTHFFTDAGVVKAVDGVSFHVHRSEVFGLVGESGCGKSQTAFSIMRLVDPPGRVVNGQVHFDGKEILSLQEKELIDLRGSQFSMIFQQPQSSLNPVFTIGDQVAEVLEIHQGMKKSAAREQAIELLRRVGIPDPDRRARSYPHEISGGQAQRVMIAMALALRPQLLIADEPTTALDVTIQAQILDLIRELTTQYHTAVILITHDLGVIAEMADRVAVMYAGRIVEQTEVADLFDRPRHPYTQGLLASIPVLGEVKERLEVIPGTVPNLIDMPPGCRFAPRCKSRLEYSLEICTDQEPDLLDVGLGHTARCWLYQSTAGHHAPLTAALGEKAS
jgi:oligopeptide/dipeptide ABC transporter ATP-binding protein